MSPVALSCTSFSFPLLELDRVLALLRLLEMDLVDLCIADGDREVRAADVVADPDGLGTAHRRLCDRYGLGVADVFAHLGANPFDRPVNTPDPQLRTANRDRLRRYLRYAAAVGSPGLTISPGVGTGAGAFGRAADELGWLVAHGADCGVAIHVEPHVDSVADTATSAALLCERVPGLGLTLDYSHFVVAGTDVGEVHPLWQLAHHAHLRQARPGHLQCPMADGVLDVGAVLARAQRSDFDGSIAIEYVHTPSWGMNRLDVLSETIRMRDEVRRCQP